MPRGLGGRRKKTRTHVRDTGEGEGQKVPKSFVVRQGKVCLRVVPASQITFSKVGSAVNLLVEDFRRMMQPYTAIRFEPQFNYFYMLITSPV
jgi:hypothetical protein